MVEIKPLTSKPKIDSKSTRECRLEVQTLGNFLVKNCGNHLSESASRSQKVWDLFKYLLVHQGQTLLPEVVMEQLYPDQAYADPKSSVRTLVYRLRRLLGEDAGLIKFYQGGYTLKQPETFWWDVPAFVSGCQQAAQARAKGDETQAISLYRQALSLYHGDFLPECAYSDWVIPFRNHYHRLYLQNVCELLALLKKYALHREIIERADKAFFIDFFEEEIHLFYLEALLAEGKSCQARNHYQNVTAVFYQEMGIKPSPALKRFYLLSQSTDHEEEVLEFSAFKEALQNKEQASGAFCCEPDFFRFLCRLESRRLERTGQQALLVLLSVNTLDYRLPNKDSLQDAIPLLQELLQAALRKSDTFCRFNEHQFALLLTISSLALAEKVLQRIEEGFCTTSDGRLILKARIQLLQPI